MKTMKSKIRVSVLFLFLIGFSISSFGQDNPYKHSVGGVVGFIDGFSYKGFPAQNFAIQLDLGIGYVYPFLGSKVNVNFMFEKYINKGFYWFVGGGVSAGVTLFGRTINYYSGYYNYNYTFALIGVNAIGGVEYKFANIPLTLQADLRPGGSFFVNSYDKYIRFDYSFFNLSARYTF